MFHHLNPTQSSNVVEQYAVSHICACGSFVFLPTVIFSLAQDKDW